MCWFDLFVVPFCENIVDKSPQEECNVSRLRTSGTNIYIITMFIWNPTEYTAVAFVCMSG